MAITVHVTSSDKREIADMAAFLAQIEQETGKSLVVTTEGVDPITLTQDNGQSTMEFTLHPNWVSICMRWFNHYLLMAQGPLEH